MKGQFLVNSNESQVEKNIYSDKSALVLEWLLKTGIDKKEFSLRAAAREIGVSVGLVQKIFAVLVFKGFLQTEGIRTAKKFCCKKPTLLLKSWLDHYDIVKKCTTQSRSFNFS